MRRVLWAAVLLLSCGRSRSTSDRSQLDSSRTTATVSDAGVFTAAVPLTPGLVDAYVRFQRSRIEIYRSLLSQLQKLSRPDGGDALTQVRVMRDRARAEEQARKAAGLSEEQVRALDSMTAPIVQKRLLAHAFDATGVLAQWDAMKGSLPADQRADLDKSMGELKKEQDDAAALTEERRRFGDQNVTLLLAREHELTQNHQLWIRTLAGRN